MYILTVIGKESEGAFSVIDDRGDKVLYIFEEEDDAMRYVMMMEEEDDHPDMSIIEVDDKVMLSTCEIHGYEYAIITKNDIVIPPPKSDNDII